MSPFLGFSGLVRVMKKLSSRSHCHFLSVLVSVWCLLILPFLQLWGWYDQLNANFSVSGFSFRFLALVVILQKRQKSLTPLIPCDSWHLQNSSWFVSLNALNDEAYKREWVCTKMVLVTECLCSNYNFYITSLTIPSAMWLGSANHRNYSWHFSCKQRCVY